MRIAGWVRYPICKTRALQWIAGGIKAGQAITRGHPVNTSSCFKQVSNAWVRQSLCFGVVREAIAVILRKALGRAEPQKTAGVFHDLMNSIVGEAVSRGVRLDGQLLSA